MGMVSREESCCIKKRMLFKNSKNLKPPKDKERDLKSDFFFVSLHFVVMMMMIFLRIG
jgi:hypothetical protein